MGIPIAYNKRVKHTAVLSLAATICLLVTFCSVSSGRITQHVLETNSLARQKYSSYNPRNIAFAVYQYLNNNSELGGQGASSLGSSDGIYFHWDDWVDLAPGDRILARYKENYPTGSCDSSLEKFAAVNGYWMESYTKKVMRGMANVYCSKPIPERIFVPTDDAMIEVPVSSKKRLGPENLPSKVSKDQLISAMTKLQSKIKQGSVSPTTTPMKRLQKSVQVSPSDFIFDPDAEIFKLQEKATSGAISSEELKYLEFLEYSNGYLADNSDKYFKYPWIITDVVNGRSHHLAYPFFKGFISDRERQSVIQHMVRAWFQFAEMHGFASWINYGSLLGWAYNGVNMPWDTDIDIQMPITQLDRMGRFFNRSMILENPRFGNAKYFLEVAPTYIRQGNGKNFIDARFIDINSGLYIDISALSHTKFKTPPHTFPDQDISTMAVHCKNWNWHSLEELLPIRHTYFEGASVYIPHNVTQILSRKYGKESYTTKLEFLGHNYQQDISLWVPDNICTKAPKKNRFDSSGGLTLEGACNSHFLQDEFAITRESARRHQELNAEIDSPTNYDPAKLEDLPIFRKDAWDYLEDINQGAVNNDDWYVREVPPNTY